MPTIHGVPLVRTGDSPLVVILSDVHIGAIEHCESEFDEALRWIRKNKAWVILNGDIVENAVAAGKAPGDKLLGQEIAPTEQLKIAAKKLKPLRERIVFSTRGNHEGRTRRESLLDISELLSEMLGVPYAGIGGMIRFQAKKNLYTFAVQHGRGGGKNIWLETRRMMDLYPHADLVALGHNHALDCQRVSGITTAKTGAEEISDRWMVRTGSYLGFADYVREMVLSPGNVGSPIITLGDADRCIDVDTGTLAWPAM